ncbi:hypothetical protein [Mycolicibacterium sp.]|uniref:hypothetical protein n=1 Tax=Mycolicibacterium sp. TaxID=2320850 RepID=UPI0037CA4B32
MDYLIGPSTGDMAFDAGTWARVDAETFGSPVPLLLVDESQFPNANRYGLLTAEQNPSGAWRVLDGLAVDVSSRYEVDIYDVRNLPSPDEWNEDKVVKIAGTVFSDPHPDKWWRDIHDNTGRIAVLVGPLKRFLEPGNRVNWAFLEHARLGVCCLVVRAYESGIGTRPPAKEEMHTTAKTANAPSSSRAEEDRRALGLDGPEINEKWGRFYKGQLMELANDVRVSPDKTDYEGIRRPWLSSALDENTRLMKMSEIVCDFADSFVERSPLAPGAIYSIRCRAFYDSVCVAAERRSSARPSKTQVDLELKAMVSARLWMKSPAYFVPRAHVEAAVPAEAPLTSYTLPNAKCLVFHDYPLPIDPPIRGAQRSVFAWVFISDEDGTLEATQVFTVADDNTDFVVTNGSIDSPALRGWASRILPTLTSAQWSPAPHPNLPGRPMERTWRRALDRKRAREVATGSLDGVRLLPPSA